ncbi:MAG: hypothetical protein Kow0026_01750 [Oricola sp.]
MKRVLLIATLLPSPAFAQEVQDIDVDEIEYCLSEAGYSGPADEHQCIGFIADSCEKGDNQPEPGSPTDCLTREAAAWNEIAARRYNVLREKTKPEIARSIADAQDSWSRYREAQCGAAGAFFSQYSGSASAEWQAKCLRDTAAERALLLDDWLLRMEDF